MATDPAKSSESPSNLKSAGRPVKLSLRLKAWLVTASVLAALAGLLGFGIDLVFRRATAELERKWVAECVRRTQTVQTAELDALERSARDYSTWDETYKFVADANPAYVDTNMAPSVLSNLQLDGFLVFDRNGRSVQARVYENGETSSEDLADLTAVLAPYARSVSRHETVQAERGIVRVGGRLAMFAMLPVLHDDQSGPARGGLAHMRFLNESRLGRLRDSVNLALTLQVTETSGSVVAPPQTSPAPSYQVTIVDDNRLKAEIPVIDADGRVVGRWELALDREIHRHGAKTRLVFYGVLGVLIVAAALLIGWLLRSMVIARLEALHAAVQRVETTGDLSVRLPLRGNDELTSLTEGVNRMFAALAQGEAQRTAAAHDRERLRLQLQEAQKLEALGTLAGGLAHDFNNLLTSMLGSIALLRLETMITPAADQHLQRLKRAAEHAAQLVRQMMAFGRRGPTVFRELHLHEVVKDAMNLAGPSLPRGIALNVRNEADADLVRADAGQFQQVLINLVTNAGQAMAGGVGVLEIIVSTVHLPDRSRPETVPLPEGDYLRLVVRDTGCGIPPEHLPRVLEPFYTTKPVGSGSGLGLSVAHGIIASHGGTIGIESQVGHGTTVYIHLPKVQPQVIEEAKPRPAPVPGAKGRLLLVDDDLLVRETLHAGARRMGYQVVSASGAVEALHIVEADKEGFDAVISDQMMPGMTGIELGERLAVLCPGLPIILITGYMDGVNVAKAEGAGFSAMLHKPVTVEELDHAIRQLRREPGE